MRESATGQTARDSYPNWIAAQAASANGRNAEALDYFRRAVTSPEPVNEVFETYVKALENDGKLAPALGEAEKASRLFGDVPDWTVTRIRLNRKLGNTVVAQTMTINCGVNTPNYRSECNEANQTPAPPAHR